jgi:hypothetical protein
MDRKAADTIAEMSVGSELDEDAVGKPVGKDDKTPSQMISGRAFH